MFPHRYVHEKSGEAVWTEGGFAENWITRIFHPRLTIGRRRQRAGDSLINDCCGEYHGEDEDEVEGELTLEKFRETMSDHAERSRSLSRDIASGARQRFDSKASCASVSLSDSGGGRIGRDAPTLEAMQVPVLQVAILVVGTHGDVLPFIGLAKRMQKDGHKVRLASHAQYAGLIQGHNVQFYPLKGDPKQLSAWMVQCGGSLLPRNLKEAKLVPKKTKMIREILESTWPACTAPDPISREPFLAQAIISNPVTYGHIHVAEALSVPLHIMFPQPWAPTTAFPHPLAQLSYDSKPHRASVGPSSTVSAQQSTTTEYEKSSLQETSWNSAQRSLKKSTTARVNKLSYSSVDKFQWVGLRQDVNNFRRRVLGLDAMRAITLILLATFSSTRVPGMATSRPTHLLATSKLGLERGIRLFLWASVQWSSRIRRRWLT